MAFTAYYLLPTAYFLLPGCADSPSGDGGDRSDRIMKDPMHYRPEFEKRDESANDIGRTDKDGLRKDLDHVFNP